MARRYDDTALGACHAAWPVDTMWPPRQTVNSFHGIWPTCPLQKIAEAISASHERMSDPPERRRDNNKAAISATTTNVAVGAPTPAINAAANVRTTNNRIPRISIVDALALSPAAVSTEQYLPFDLVRRTDRLPSCPGRTGSCSQIVWSRRLRPDGPAAKPGHGSKAIPHVLSIVTSELLLV
jgi:hypothetical protein